MFFSKGQIFLLGTAFALTNYASADSTFPLETVISSQQKVEVTSSIQKSIQSLRGVPNGIKIDDVFLAGDFFLDDNKYLTSVKIDSLNYEVKIPILFYTQKVNVKMQLRADIPNGDCSNPVNIIVTSSADDITGLIDSVIRKYADEHAASLIKDYFIKMTDLNGYCAVKPI